MEFEKRYNDQGQVAILVSPGFGAGWSTWCHNPAQVEGMLFDSRLVDYVLTQGTESMESYAESLGYEGYFGGASDLEVIWIDQGTRFTVEEYDGSESVRTFDDLCYVA